MIPPADGIDIPSYLQHWLTKAHDHPLPDALAVAVPLRIAKFQAQGGPTDTDWESLSPMADRIAHQGDVLLYGGKKGQAARLFCDLVDAIAILAYVPGGVTVCGVRYRVEGE